MVVSRITINYMKLNNMKYYIFIIYPNIDKFHETLMNEKDISMSEKGINGDLIPCIVASK